MAIVFCDWCGASARSKNAVIKNDVAYCSKACNSKSTLNKKIQGFNGTLAANMITDFMSTRQVEAFLVFLDAQGY